MKSYSAYFVRTDALEKAQAIFGKAVERLPDSPWLLCAYQPDDDPPEDAILFGDDSLTAAKSEQIGEVIFVYGDTSTDWFVYEHADTGLLLRKLVWFTLPDDDYASGWVCVEGLPEVWESTLFRAEMLTQYLERERQRLTDEGHADDMDERLAEIQTIWHQGRILANKTFPECDGTVALLVEKGLGINRFG